MLARILIAFLLLTVTASAQTNGLTQLNHFKNEAYRLMQIDTTGASNIVPLADMNQFVRRAVDQMPTFVRGRELVKQVIITDSTSNVFLDSLVQSVKIVIKTDHDSLLIIQQRPVGIVGVDFSTGTHGEDDQDIRYFHYFADTLYFYPQKTNKKDDTLRVYYYQTPIFADQTNAAPITMARPFQLGVVYYTVYLAEIRRNIGKEAEAWKRYTDWLSAVIPNVIGRPIDLLRDEKP